MLLLRWVCDSPRFYGSRLRTQFTTHVALVAGLPVYRVLPQRYPAYVRAFAFYVHLRCAAVVYTGHTVCTAVTLLLPHALLPQFLLLRLPLTFYILPGWLVGFPGYCVATLPVADVTPRDTFAHAHAHIRVYTHIPVTHTTRYRTRLPLRTFHALGYGFHVAFTVTAHLGSHSGLRTVAFILFCRLPFTVTRLYAFVLCLPQFAVVLPVYVPPHYVYGSVTHTYAFGYVQLPTTPRRLPSRLMRYHTHSYAVCCSRTARCGLRFGLRLQVYATAYTRLRCVFVCGSLPTTCYGFTGLPLCCWFWLPRVYRTLPVTFFATFI